MTPADESRPLASVTVLVTRTKAQAGKLVRALDELGATVRAMPVIELVDPPDWAPADAAIEHLESYDWIVFSSANAVDRFLERVQARGTEFPQAGIVRVAAVGPATAERCRKYGIEPDYVPDEAIAEGLIDGFEQLGLGTGTRVLVPRALVAREVLPEALRARGAVVDVAPVYCTVGVAPDPAIVEEIAAGGIGAVTFTSPSTVRSFFGAVEGTSAAGPARKLLFASIGPVTTDALHVLGLEAHAEAPEHTATGLASALAECVRVGTHGDTLL